MSKPIEYQLPGGPVALNGPVARPAPGTLPLRGDLAHIALAGKHLAAHYVIPLRRRLAGGDAVLKLYPQDNAEDGARIETGAELELLDQTGAWAWVTCGPEGPSGYLPAAQLTAG